MLIVDKPAGLPTMGVEPGRPTLLDEAREYVRRKYQKPGNVYLGIVSRLDAPVTGAVVIARTSKAAARLSEQFRQREVDKTYWALVSPPPRPAVGECVDQVRKDERHRRMHVCGPDASPAQLAQAQWAQLRYRTLRNLSQDISLLEVELLTGRKHQIRLQLGSRGWPVVGDRKYGSRRDFPRGIALHARRVRLIHPVRKTPLEIVAPVPDYWRLPPDIERSEGRGE